MKPFIEFLAYNDRLLLTIIGSLCAIGSAVVLDMLVVRPIQWLWSLLWKGMDDEDRYETINITFKSARW